MFSLIAVFALLYIVSLAVKVIFDLKIEAALFAVMCAVIVFQTVMGLFSWMHIAQIVIYCAAGLSLVYLIYKAAVQKHPLKIGEAITPGVVLIVFAVLFYFLAVRNNVFHIKDEVTAYGISVKRMLATNRTDIFGSVPVFAYFVNKLAGFSEGMVFTSKWLFMWICLCLPLTNLKWDKWYVALIYGAVGFGVLTLINPEPMFLMDGSIGVMSGALAGYLSVNLKKSCPVVLGLGLMVLTMIKDMAGILFGMFVLLFMAVYAAVVFAEKEFKINRKSVINAAVIVVSAALSVFLAAKTVGMPQVVRNVFSSYKIILALGALVLLAAGLLVLYKKVLHKHIKGKIAAAGGTVLFFGAAAAIYKITWKAVLSFGYDRQQDFVYSLSKYFGKTYFGINFTALIGLAVVFLVAISIAALKKEYIKHAVSQACAMIFVMFIYGFMVAYIFTVQYSSLLSDMNGLERYMGSVVIMALVWLMGMVFAAGSYWQNNTKQIVSLCVLSSLLIRSYPVYGETMFNIYNVSTISFREGVRPFAEKHAEKLMEYTPEDAVILFVNQNTGENYSNTGVEYWINYFMVPRRLGSRVSSFSADKTKAGGIFSVFCTKEQFGELISGSDYVYVMETDDTFWESYGEYFPERTDGSEGTLYEVIKDGKLRLSEIPAG